MKIKILSHTYELTEVEDSFNGHWGQSSPKEGWIKISSRMKNDHKNSTILHEVVHIASDLLDAGLKDEENKISAISMALYSFMKSNPDLIRSMLLDEA